MYTILQISAIQENILDTHHNLLSHQEYHSLHCNCSPFPFFQQIRILPDYLYKRKTKKFRECLVMQLRFLILKTLHTHSISAVASHARASHARAASRSGIQEEFNVSMLFKRKIKGNRIKEQINSINKSSKKFSFINNNSQYKLPGSHLGSS